MPAEYFFNARFRDYQIEYVIRFFFFSLYHDHRETNRAARKDFIVTKNICLHHQLIGITDNSFLSHCGLT